MEIFYTTLASYLLEAPQTGWDGCMHTFNRELINATRAAYPNGMDSVVAMKVYQILENYFLYIVGAQFQAENIIINCCNVYDSLNVHHSAKTSFSTFTGTISPEIPLFLKEVDFLVVNIDDYRNTPRWTHDVQYADMGLAPDITFNNVLARAQFLANSLYSALNLPYQTFYGKIITPYNYTYNNGTQPTTYIYLDHADISSTATKVVSVIPNTVWPTVGDVSTCDYDFNWSVFTFGQLGEPDPFNAPSSLPAAVHFSDNYNPWAHSTEPQGLIPAKYYNPQNLYDVSDTYDKIHCIHFGYFSANWKWGFLYLRYDNEHWANSTYFEPEQLLNYSTKYHSSAIYDCNHKLNSFHENSPYVCGCNGSWNVCSQSAYTGIFSVNMGGYQVGLSEMAYKGPTFNYTSGQTSYIFNMVNKIKAARTIPGNTAWYVWQAASWYSFGDQFNCNGGVGYKSLPAMAEGSLINSSSFYQLQNRSPNSPGWSSTVGGGGNFSANKEQDVNFGFDLFINKNVSLPSNLTMLFHPNTAVVFGGSGTPVK